MHIPSIRDGLICAAAVCLIVTCTVVGFSCWAVSRYMRDIRDIQSKSMQDVVDEWQNMGLRKGR